jgi:hypothetical protein
MGCLSWNVAQYPTRHPLALEPPLPPHRCRLPPASEPVSAKYGGGKGGVTASGKRKQGAGHASKRAVWIVLCGR